MLPAFALVATISNATPAIEPGTYTYSASYGGRTAGSATVVVRGGAVTAGTPTTEIDEQSQGAMDGREGSAQTKLVLAGDLSPVAYHGLYNLAGESSTADARLTPTSATIGGESFGLLGGAKHFVVLEPGLLSGLVALPAQMNAWNDSAVTALIPSIGLAATISPDASLTGARPPGVPPHDLALSFGGPSPFTIWYDPASYVADEVDVPAQNIVVTRTR